MKEIFYMNSKTIDPDLCEDEIKHTQMWKKHKDTINLLYINEVKF